MSYDEYLSELRARLWRYRQQVFGQSNYYFDDWQMSADFNRMPVFRREHADKNVLVRPGASPAEQRAVLKTLRCDKRHRYFASMRSSQALAQSVFANLKVYESLECLLDVRDGGGPLFPLVDANSLFMEHGIDFLGEREQAQTSVDVMFCGNYQVAVECKLAEEDVGCCSQPPDWCDGTYTLQGSRPDRCALSTKGVRYWTFVPQVTNWAAESDYDPCPLYRTYQLIRNLLAACIRPADGVPTTDPERGHVVLIVDERNPEFKNGGQGHKAVRVAWAGLRDPTRLRVCTWQEILVAMRKDPRLDWLTEGLRLKYGL